MMNNEPGRLAGVPVSEIDLAALGLGEVAYVRSIDVEAVQKMVGPEVRLDPEQDLFCLYMADGTPVAVSDSREAAVANAIQHDLRPAAVH